jgi:hypothetical protein
VHQIGDRSGIETEALLRNHRDETGAGFEIRIIEFAIALVLLEVLGVGGGKKCALVVIKPPGNLGGAGVLEINDGVLVAVKLLFVKQGASAVDQSGEDKIDIAANALAIEARKQGGRGSSVKTLVVVENADSQ